MTFDDPHLLVRAASLYLCALLTAAACVWRRPTPRAVAAAMLAGVWNLPVLLALHIAADRWNWWTFDADGGLLLGLPVDLYLTWAWLWGVLPALVFRTLPLPAVVAIALAFDLILMPAAAPVVALGPAWLVGESIGLVAGLVPAQLLARWTMRDSNLQARALLQVMAFSGLLLFVLPAVVVEGSGGAWSSPVSRPGWQLSLIAQAIFLPAVLGVTAVQEFVTRGKGTPVPFDPPTRLVTTGVYAYVRNPMQLSATLVLIVLGAATGSIWIAAAGLMAHVYSVGLAGWDEDEDLRARFGEDWRAYRRHVRNWMPRRRPWHPPDRAPASLFVSERCDMCSQVGMWFGRRQACGLSIVPAESHPSRALSRITYEPADGGRPASGIEAIARALEHIHFGWACVGFALRLPVLRQTAQLLADASGAEARAIGRTATISRGL